MSGKNIIFKQQLFKKNHMIFFLFSPENLLIVLYRLIHGVSRRYHDAPPPHTHTHGQAETNMSPTFVKLGA